MKSNKFSKTDPTVGYNVETVSPYLRVFVEVWDIAGGCRYLWKDYKNLDGLVYVVDSSDSHRIIEAAKRLHDFLAEVRNMNGAPILIIANKQDRLEALKGSDLIDRLSLWRLKNKWLTQDLSAVNGHGVSECMEMMYDMVMDHQSSYKTFNNS